MGSTLSHNALGYLLGTVLGGVIILFLFRKRNVESNDSSQNNSSSENSSNSNAEKASTSSDLKSESASCVGSVSSNDEKSNQTQISEQIFEDSPLPSPEESQERAQDAAPAATAPTGAELPSSVPESDTKNTVEISPSISRHESQAQPNQEIQPVPTAGLPLNEEENLNANANNESAAPVSPIQENAQPASFSVDILLRAEPQTDSAEAELKEPAASPRTPVFSPRELDTIEQESPREVLIDEQQPITLLATPAKGRPRPKRTHAVTQSVSQRFKEASSEPTFLPPAPGGSSGEDPAPAPVMSPTSASKAAAQGGVRLMMPVPTGFKLKSTKPPGSPE